jgi:hypothetical protein
MPCDLACGTQSLVDQIGVFTWAQGPGVDVR